MSFKNKAAGIGLAIAISIAAPLVARHEGLSLSAYLDPIGIPTICYGSTSGVKLGQTKTQAECDELLRNDLGKAVKIVDKYIRVPMPETRRAALASFVYNVGEGSFKRSTLLKKINSGDWIGGCNELRKWVYAGGIKFNGLVKRREAERELCLRI